MEWENVTWTVGQLLSCYESGKLNLSPEYQRNPIWTSKAQKRLIDTILSPQPMPNFFLLKKSSDEYEMVDGQQRARSIISFKNGYISSSAGVKYHDISSDSFFGYGLNVILITSLGQSESIEQFYSLVNSSGIRLNAPELRKAKYYDTNFLVLCNEMADYEKFSSLGLFGSGTLNRMNDVELVSELLALLLYGPSEKKEEVERLFEEDIEKNKIDELRNRFIFVVGIISNLNKVCPIKKTRFKQRADMYTLFDFIWNNKSMNILSFYYYYKILLKIETHIRPTQEHCDSLRDYARNCVSQSNSKKARTDRSNFFKELLCNNSYTPNNTQDDIINFLKLDRKLKPVENFFTINIED